MTDTWVSQSVLCPTMLCETVNGFVTDPMTSQISGVYVDLASAANEVSPEFSLEGKVVNVPQMM